MANNLYEAAFVLTCMVGLLVSYLYSEAVAYPPGTISNTDMVPVKVKAWIDKQGRECIEVHDVYGSVATGCRDKEGN